MLADLANLRGASAVRTFTHFVFLLLLDGSIVSQVGDFVKNFLLLSK